MLQWTRILRPLLAVLLLAAVTPLRAHHGLDFLLVQDAYVPAPLSGVFYGGVDWVQQNGADLYGSEPGVMLGLLPGLALGVSSTISGVNSDWQIYGLSPYLQMQLLPKAWSKRVRLAARAGYEFSVNPYVSTVTMPVTRIETIENVETITVTRPAPAAPKKGGNSGGNSGGGGPDGGSGPDGAAPKHAGHGHTASASGGSATRATTTRVTTTTREVTTYEQREIENHVEGWNARLMFEADLTGSDRLVLNLVHLNLRTESPVWGYAAGLRHAFHHDFAVSLEALGNFNQDDWHQAVFAAHYAPVHWGLIKVGAAFGLTSETPDLSLITSFVIRF